MIRMDRVVRSYADFRLEMDLTVDRGEIVTLLGHSGSGKTTTLRILAGFERCDTGRIVLDGEDITDLSAQERGLGFVFQDYTLFPHLDVGANIAYGLRVQKIPRARRERRVRELLDLVGLEGFENRPVHTLSGGEQQRVAVARALAPEPRALLLDEPFSAIDTERRETLRRHLLRIQRELGLPTVFVTHSRTEALFLSDRILVMREGQVIDQGSPQDLYERPATEYAARFLGAANFLRPEGGTPLMIRPEHVEIIPESGQDGRDVSGSTSNGVASNGVHEGIILEQAYYGAWWEYTLDTRDGPIVVVTPRFYTTGSSLRYRLPPERLIPVQPTKETAPPGPDQT